MLTGFSYPGYSVRLLSQTLSPITSSKPGFPSNANSFPKPLCSPNLYSYRNPRFSLKLLYPLLQPRTDISPLFCDSPPFKPILFPKPTISPLLPNPTPQTYPHPPPCVYHWSSQKVSLSEQSGSDCSVCISASLSKPGRSSSGIGSSGGHSRSKNGRVVPRGKLSLGGV
jgi:hypothetical protein